MKNTNMNRRTFLKVTTVAGGGLLVGCSFSSPNSFSSSNEKDGDLGLFVRIKNNDQIQIISPNSELGQGIHTAHAMIICEEMEADWKKVSVTTGSYHPEYKKNMFVQSTGGSNGVSAWKQKLSEIGAGIKEMLIEAGAEQMRVPKKECIALNSFVIHKPSKNSVRFGQIAKNASKLSFPNSPTLKNSSEYKLVGKSIFRVDIPQKVNGKALFAGDIKLPGMMYAQVAQSPVFGGDLKSFDKKSALKSPGVEAVIAIPNGIAVVADTTWHAIKGLEALKPTFGGGINEILSSKTIDKSFNEALNSIKESSKDNMVLDVEYSMPFLSHAAIESTNCTANVTSNSCEIWVPTQSQSICFDKILEITGLSEENITIHTPYVGGGFGRRIEVDEVVHAVMISKEMNKPVQVLWSREEDIQHDHYHSGSKARYQIKLDAKGLPKQWDNQVVKPDFMAQNYKILDALNFNPFNYLFTPNDSFIPGMIGLQKSPYNIDNVSFDYTNVDPGVPIGAWRSVFIGNAFYIESAIDEVAHFAKQEPLEYRKKLIGDNPRILKILDLLAKQSNWSKPLPPGHGKGIALFHELDAVTAQVATVSVSPKGKLKILKIDCVLDLGNYVNPSIVKSQIEGGIVMGISSALKENIIFEKGKVSQSNFDDYKIAKMKDIPEIEINLIESDADAKGVDMGVFPVAPSITNAIFAATGKRIRHLPIGKQKLV